MALIMLLKDIESAATRQYGEDNDMMIDYQAIGKTLADVISGRPRQWYSNVSLYTAIEKLVERSHAGS